MNLKNLLLSRFKDKFYLWVPVSSTGKVFCRRAKDLSSNPAYTKNQLVSWLNGKSKHHRFKFYRNYKKKKKKKINSIPLIIIALLKILNFWSDLMTK